MKEVTEKKAWEKPVLQKTDINETTKGGGGVNIAPLDTPNPYS